MKPASTSVAAPSAALAWRWTLLLLLGVLSIDLGLYLRPQIASHDVIIASYDVIRNEIEFFRTLHFSYVVLDEGHIIKNPKSAITKAVKSVKAFRRLILSGTPIQNNVVELWSLFDFLMPGYLGDYAHFNKRYAKPIQSSYNAKAKSTEQEAGIMALDALHKQVLPFLMRRMKEDVLSDLPPKIIQDYYCDLSPLQSRLYQTFGSQYKNSVSLHSMVS